MMVSLLLMTYNEQRVAVMTSVNVEYLVKSTDVKGDPDLSSYVFSDDFHEDHYNDTDTSDQALVSVDDSEQDEGSGHSYVGYIVGTFFAIFILMLIVAFFGYR